MPSKIEKICVDMYINKRFISERMLIVSLIFLMTCMLFDISESYAESNIRIGKMVIEPSLKYAVQYHDNIFYDKRNEEEDVIHIITPGVEIKYSGARPENFLRAGYKVDLAHYDDNDEMNYQKQMPYASLGYKSPSGFYINAHEFYTKTQDPYGSKNDYRLGRKTKRWYNDVSGTLGYEISRKYSIELFYQNLTERYDESFDQWQERDGDLYGISLLYHWTPKTSIFAQYRRSDFEYVSQNDDLFDPDRHYMWTSDTSQDYTLDDFFVGFRFKPTGKITGELKVGYGELDYDNRFDPTGKKYDDGSTWIAETLVGYELTTRTSLTLNLQRYYLNSPNLDISYYEDTIIGLRVTQEIVDRFKAWAYLEWEHRDYKNERPGFEDRSFDIYSAHLALDWTVFRWLTAGFEYVHTEQEADKSDYENEEYNTNSLMGYIEIIY